MGILIKLLDIFCNYKYLFLYLFSIIVIFYIRIYHSIQDDFSMTLKREKQTQTIIQKYPKIPMSKNLYLI